MTSEQLSYFFSNFTHALCYIDAHSSHTFQVAFTFARPVQIPSELAFNLTIKQLPLTLRSVSPETTHRWLAIMTKFVIHIRQAALGAQQRLAQHFERMRLATKRSNESKGAAQRPELAQLAGESLCEPNRGGGIGANGAEITWGADGAVAIGGQGLDTALSSDVRVSR
jgi:hypothetical protein